MPLMVRGEDMPVRRRVHTSATGEGSMEVRKAYGKDCNLMIGTRAPGYHSRPHVHDCEQINYIAEGELWLFVEDKAYYCKKGDFQRVPRNKIHWAWNRGDQPCLLIEAHSPPLMGGDVSAGAAGLFDDDESPDVPVKVGNVFVDYDTSIAEANVK